MKSVWFPDRQLIPPSAHLIDEVFGDLEQQGELFSGQEGNAAQLTPGQYDGRLLSVALGGVHMLTDYSAQSVLVSAFTPPNVFQFSVVLEEYGGFSSFGLQQTLRTVNVRPPGGQAELVHGAGGTMMILNVDQDGLFSNSVLTPDVVDWLRELPAQGAMIHSKLLADRLARLHGDVVETAAGCTSQNQLDYLAQVVVLQLCSSLALVWETDANIGMVRPTIKYDRFRLFRDALHEMIRNGHQSLDQNIQLGGFSELGSKRSIEQAFKSSVGMGPLQYWRLIRLHNVRRKLLQYELIHQTIGDIAAEEGFWDQSKFGRYYRRAFGERPSETRKRLDPAVLSRHRL